MDFVQSVVPFAVSFWAGVAVGVFGLRAASRKFPKVWAMVAKKFAPKAPAQPE